MNVTESYWTIAHRTEPGRWILSSYEYGSRAEAVADFDRRHIRPGAYAEGEKQGRLHATHVTCTFQVPED